MAKKQKSGLYRGRVRVGVNADGKPLYKYISAKTQRALEDERRRVEMRYAGLLPAGGVAFGDYMTRFFERKKQTGLSASSLNNYRVAINTHIAPVFAHRLIHTITPGELQDFVNQYTGKSASAITYIVAALNGTFRAAMQDRIIRDNPMLAVDKPKATKAAEKRPLTADERQRIVSACSTHRHGGYLAALYYLGCRPGEGRGLKWGDFDWEAMTVHIQRDIDPAAGNKEGNLKTERSNRVVPVPNALAAILRPRAGAPDAYCFTHDNGQILGYKTRLGVWRDIMISCGLVRYDEDGNAVPTVRPHDLRHNYITMCWEAGVDPYTTMRLVGHTSIKTTMDIYTHLSDRARNTIGDKINTIFG